MSGISSQPQSLASRRMFFAHGGQCFQIFSFEQKRDGSIYISSPSFADTKWVVPRRDPPRIQDVPGSEKLSVHGSGVVHVKADALASLRQKGSPLVISSSSMAVRHLLTSAISEPRHVPASPAFNRFADLAVESADFAPMVFAFWAVPLVAGQLTLEVSGSFHVDDLEPGPPAMGMGAFELRTHYILWWAYRTKHMTSWPKSTYSAFDDGYYVPLIIGAAEKVHRLELRVPHYSYEHPLLTIAV